MTHITDTQIQEMLDGKYSNNIEILKCHLNGCSLCIKNLKQYQTLYQELEKEPDYQFSENFTDLLISHLPQKNNRFPIFSFIEPLLIIIGLSISFVIVNNILNITSISKIKIHLLATIQEISSEIIVSFKHIISYLNGNITLLIIALSILILIRLIDNIISSSNFKKRLSLFI